MLSYVMSQVVMQVRSLALYLSEMSLVDGENFLRYPPSQVHIPPSRALYFALLSF
jgi:hypothetical protein